MTACCYDTAGERPCDGESQEFRPIGGERRRYRPPMPVIELLQLAAAVAVCGAVIGGFFG